MAMLGVQLSPLPCRWHRLDCSLAAASDMAIGDEDDGEWDSDDGDDEDRDDDKDDDEDNDDDEDGDDGEDFAISRWHMEHNFFSSFLISQLCASFFRTTLLKIVVLANHIKY